MPYNRNIYTLDHEKLAHWLVPVRWRYNKLMVLVKSLAITWIDLFNRFVLYRERVKYTLLITPQVCYLEKALNDKYDVSQRRIVLQDGEEHLPVILFTRDEQKLVYLFKRSEDALVYLTSRNETAEFGVDFIAIVPPDVVFNNAEMSTYITAYKLATKTFEIV